MDDRDGGVYIIFLLNNIIFLRIGSRILSMEKPSDVKEYICL